VVGKDGPHLLHGATLTQRRQRREKVTMAERAVDLEGGNWELRTLYKHSPLPSQRSIRLLRILGMNEDETPQCSLTMFNIDNAPTYFALSYTWGSPSEAATKKGYTKDRSCSIVCDGLSFSVTHNLLDFIKMVVMASPCGGGNAMKRGLAAVRKVMHRQRRPSCGDYIWIDAISIDQDNNDERSSQVNFMTEIYSRATCTVVWLGEEDEETSKALDLFQHIKRFSGEVLAVCDPFDRTEVEAKSSNLLGMSYQHWRAAVSFVSRNWFSRKWVIQEFVLSKRHLIMCGSMIVSWEKLVHLSNLPNQVLARFDEQENFTDKFSLKYAHPHLLETLREQHKSGEGIGLLQAMLISAQFDVTDDRDQVYAILGLALPSLSSPVVQYLTPDYKLSVEDVYIKVTRAIIVSPRGLRIFQLSEFSHLWSHHDMQTWVPDYSSKMVVDFARYAHSYAAGNLSKSIRTLHDPRLLGLTGIKFDNVVETEEEELIGTQSDTFFFKRRFLKWLEIVSYLGKRYITGETRLECFWRTAIENYALTEDYPVPKQYYLDFRSFVLNGMADALLDPDLPVEVPPPIERALDLCDQLTGGPPDILPTSDEVRAHTKAQCLSTAFGYADLIAYYGRKMFRTRKLLLGMGVRRLREGDSIWIIPGSKVPIALREGDQDGRFRLIGPAYVHGYMNSEVVTELERGDLRIEEIVLE
jgi:Heterokaryon incompatibility protein (HET)